MSLILKILCEIGCHSERLFAGWANPLVYILLACCSLGVSVLSEHGVFGMLVFFWNRSVDQVVSFSESDRLREN